MSRITNPNSLETLFSEITLSNDTSRNIECYYINCWFKSIFFLFLTNGIHNLCEVKLEDYSNLARRYGYPKSGTPEVKNEVMNKMDIFFKKLIMLFLKYNLCDYDHNGFSLSDDLQTDKAINLDTILTQNNNSFELIHSNDTIFFTALSKYKKSCVNLPYFELYIIDFLKLLNANVMEVVYFEDRKVYCDLHKYYNYTSDIDDEIKDKAKNKDLSDTIKLELSNYSRIITYREESDYYQPDKSVVKKVGIKTIPLRKNEKKLDFIIVVHNKYNSSLMSYYSELRKIKDNKLVEYRQISPIDKNITMLHFTDKKFNSKKMKSLHFSDYTDMNREYVLSACLLRNNNSNIKTKTILAFIEYSYVDNSDDIDYDDPKIVQDPIKVTISWSIENQYIIDDTTEDKIKEFKWIKNNNFTNKLFFIEEDGFKYEYNFATGDKILIYGNIHSETNTEITERLNEINLERLNIDYDESSASTVSR